MIMLDVALIELYKVQYAREKHHTFVLQSASKYNKVPYSVTLLWPYLSES